MITLKEFLQEVNWKENNIINYSWDEALKKVKKNWNAIQFVDKSIFKQEVNEYTMEELIEKLWHNFKLIK